MKPMSAQQEALVLFMPSGRRGRFPVGTPVLDAARSLGVYIESVCGGRGICGRCQIVQATGQFAKHGITSAADNISPANEVEARYAGLRSLAPERRLSCQARVEGDLVIDVPQDVQVNRQIVRKRAETRHIDRKPATRLYYVEVEEPDMEKPLGDLDRLFAALKREWKIDGLTADFRMLSHIPDILRDGEWKVTVAVHDDGRSPAQVIAAWPGFNGDAYGVAVDIGSTTIAVHLSSLLSGRTVASSGTSNPQIRFGEDLMSRVSYVMMNPDGREALTRTVREAINTLIERVCSEGGIRREHVLEAVFVANPVMHHLFLGLDPVPLGSAPFALAVSSSLDIEASQIGIEINLHHAHPRASPRRSDCTTTNRPCRADRARPVPPAPARP